VTRALTTTTQSLRLKNQIQFLNEEDAEYLETLSKNELAQKAASEKQAREQLAAFRKQQEDAERAAIAGGQAGDTQEEGETWSIGARKRKKGTEHDLIKGVKLRKTLSTDKAEVEIAKATIEDSKKSDAGVETGATKKANGVIAKSDSPGGNTVIICPIKAASPSVGLGLGAYSSDEDD
jgi:hypothetical protein